MNRAILDLRPVSLITDPLSPRVVVTCLGNDDSITLDSDVVVTTDKDSDVSAIIDEDSFLAGAMDNNPDLGANDKEFNVDPIQDDSNLGIDMDEDSIDKDSDVGVIAGSSDADVAIGKDSDEDITTGKDSDVGPLPPSLFPDVGPLDMGI